MQAFDKEDKPIGEPVKVSKDTDEFVKQFTELSKRKKAVKIKMFFNKPEQKVLSPTQRLLAEWKIKRETR